MSNLVKAYDFVLDLAKFDESVTRLRKVIQGCAAKRAPPLAPPVFKEDLSTKTFTSPKADRETVGNLYEKEFDEKLGEATELDYQNLQWTDADVVKLCGAIATGKLVKLEGLYLGGNQIGDAGVAALAEAAGKLVKLEELDLYNVNPNISQPAQSFFESRHRLTVVGSCLKHLPANNIEAPIVRIGDFLTFVLTTLGLGQNFECMVDLNQCSVEVATLS